MCNDFSIGKRSHNKFVIQTSIYPFYQTLEFQLHKSWGKPEFQTFDIQLTMLMPTNYVNQPILHEK